MLGRREPAFGGEIFNNSARVVPGVIFFHSMRMSDICFVKFLSVSSPARDGVAREARVATVNITLLSSFMLCFFRTNAKVERNVRGCGIPKPQT